MARAERRRAAQRENGANIWETPRDSSRGGLRLEDAADVADRAGGGRGTVGHVVERLDRDRTVVADAPQRGEDRRERVAALPRPAAVAVVELDVREQPARPPALDQRRGRLLLGEGGGAGV